MLKKFINGLIFGAGFAVAFIIICFIAVTYLLPKALETAQKEPKFKNPQVAEIAKVKPSITPSSSQDFSFFKNSERGMKIPENGGVLAMSPTKTPSGSKRQSTYQLWLTHSELWQIRTTEEKTEIEKLPYPEGMPVKTLTSLMYKNLGINTSQSTITVSETEINNVKSNIESSRDNFLNGRMKITIEGVIFIQPNLYK